MNKTLSAVALSAICIAAATTSAASHAAPNDPSFDNAGISYVNLDTSGGSASGFAIDFESSALTNNWLISVDYLYASDDRTVNNVKIDFEASNLYANLGYKFYASDSFTAYASGGVTWVDSQVSSSGLSVNDDDTGWNVQLGVRSKLTDVFEIDANVRHVDVFDMSDQELSLTGRYYLTANTSFALNYTFADSDSSYFGLGGSYHF
ncbi:MAG: porin family protein [Pseudomonadota bacterium]